MNDVKLEPCRPFCGALKDFGAALPAHNGGAPTEAWTAIVAERERQISKEGWSAEHDDQHTDGAMLRAAVIYLHHDTTLVAASAGAVPNGWPWDAKWWKPKDRRSNLIRAGALCLAERDRCVRDGLRTAPADHKLGLVLAALSTAPQSQSGEVRVKPLKWQHVSDTEYTCREWDYRITWHDGKWGVSPIDWPAFDHPYDSLELAKSAVQTGHDSRIRSALEAK